MRVPIAEVMTRNVVCVFEDFSVDTLEEVLLDRRLAAVPVVDNDGTLVGFVGMADIVRELHDRANSIAAFPDERMVWGFHEEPEAPVVADLMTPIALELAETCPVIEAIRLMTTQHVHRAPVMSNAGELVGIVTVGDIVRFLARVGRMASGPVETADAGPDAGHDRSNMAEPTEPPWRPYEPMIEHEI